MRPSVRQRAEAALAADEVLLARRLRDVGLPAALSVAVHTNRTVMVSFANGRVRIHRGFAYAPDRVLAAISTFLHPRAPSAERRRAERELMAFPVHRFVPEGRKPHRRSVGSPKMLRRLRNTHADLNTQYFAGELRALRFRISGRMRTQLGEVVMDDVTGRPIEIGISRQHIERDGWEEAAKTLLHEMVHQWQAETGLPVDHGSAFRKKAREVGIEPSARRDVGLRSGEHEPPLLAMGD